MRLKNCYLQGTGTLRGTVGQWAQRVGAAAGDTHGESGEGADARALVIGSEERGTLVPDGEDSVGIADAQCWAGADLHGACGVVERLDEAAAEALGELPGDDLGRDGSLAVDEVANNLVCVKKLARPT